MIIKSLSLVVAAGLLTTACATVPTGPSVMVLPGNGKSFDQFQFDEGTCRQWAAQQTGSSPSQTATNSTVAGAGVGTLLGAAAGAAIGAAAGSPGTGAAVGAGVGLLGGTAVGAGNAQASSGSVQRRYDASYMQCMYAKGHQIPVARGSAPAYSAPRAVSTPPPPPPPPPSAATPPPPPPSSSSAVTPPPPPIGAPPPPPPGPSR